TSTASSLFIATLFLGNSSLSRAISEFLKSTAKICVGNVLTPNNLLGLILGKLAISAIAPKAKKVLPLPRVPTIRAFTFFAASQEYDLDNATSYSESFTLETHPIRSKTPNQFEIYISIHAISSTLNKYVIAIVI